MATEIIKIVDPDNGAGTDYTSLNAFESAEERDLPTADEIATAKCRSTSGTADSTAVTFTAWVTDATRYIKVWTDPAESHRHDGKWSTGKYRLALADANVLILREDVIKLIGLQLESSGSGSTNQNCITFGAGLGTPRIEVDKCIFKTIGNQEGTGILVATGPGGSELRVSNSVFQDFNGDTSSSGIRQTDGSWTSYIYNCTFYDCDTGLERGAGTMVAKNCLSNCDALNAAFTDFVGTFTTSNNNASSDGTAPGTSSRTSQTFTFVAAGSDDFHLDSADAGAKDFGADLSADGNFSFSDDIDGDTRSGSWDIGADEVTGAAPAATRFNLMLMGAGK